MKTKPFLLATAGSTVDGRVIDEKMLDEMASSYDPKTYGARLNIEHIRGVTGEGPFRAFGDVLELSTGEVDVNFNGTMEKRKALFGVLDVSGDAKALNDAGQKVYPSIEIEPNFAGKGSAYLMGCALTDSPAAIATERLQFNRSLPGALTVSGDNSAALEFAGSDTPSADSFLAKLGTVLDGFSAKFGAASEPKAAVKTDEEAKEGSGPSFDFAQMRPLFEDLGQSFSTAITALRTEMREEMDQFGVKLKAVETTAEGTPSAGHTARPTAAGASGQYAKTDC